MSLPKDNLYNVVCLRRWEGIDPRVSPLGLEFEATEGTFFDMLYRYFDFEGHVEEVTKVKSQPGDAEYEDEVLFKDRLKKMLAGGKVKITIKLEVVNDLDKILDNVR